MPGKNINSRVVDKGDWVVNLAIKKTEFDDVDNIEWLDNKKPVILDTSKYSKNMYLNNSSLEFQEKSVKDNEDNEQYNKKDLTQENLSIKVFRKLDVENPYLLETLIEINSFKDGLLVPLGSILPEGFRLLNTTRTVQLKETDGSYFATLQKGKNTILITAVSTEPIKDFKVPEIPGVEQEVWSINMKQSVFNVVGLTPASGELVKVPKEWENFPSYIKNGDFKLAEISNTNNSDNNKKALIETKRESWFNKNGDSFNVEKLEFKSKNSPQFILQNEDKKNVNILSLTQDSRFTKGCF